MLGYLSILLHENENRPVVGRRKESINLVFTTKLVRNETFSDLCLLLCEFCILQTHNYSYENAQCNLSSKEEMELKGVCDIIVGVLFLGDGCS